ncbi:MAG: VTT domain-containing protein [Bryobacter sp.]|nr:VTT domain-containing protein [Bryobacter sp.]
MAKLIALGPAGLFLLALLDSAGIPVVGGVDALLVVLANQKPEWAYGCAALAVLGSLVGSMILFAIARKGGQRYLDRLTAGPRRQRFRRWFDQYGLVTVFVPAISVIPMPMKAFVACAGVLGTRPVAFAMTVLAARVPRYLFLAWLGQAMGDNALGWIKQHSVQFGLGLAGLAVALYFIVRAQSAPQSELPPQPLGHSEK